MSYRDFPEDTFTEADVLRCLDLASLKHWDKGKYFLVQCPFHDDKTPSAQIFKNDWFVGCNAGCDRQHITKAYPELRDNHNGVTPQPRRTPMKPKVEEPKKQHDLIEQWRGLPLIPRDHTFKSIPLDVLDSLGWRWDEAKGSYYIPYFDATREHILFAQRRKAHYTDKSEKFRPVPSIDATPTIYGKWNIPDATILFLVEGTSDAACLEYAGVPHVAAPSASSGALVERFAEYCVKRGIRVVYAGDNDGPGDKIRQALEIRMPRYRTCQPPKQYKDWCDFLAAEGIEAVREYTNPELGLMPHVPITENTDEGDMLAAIASMFPGSTTVREGVPV